MRISSDPPGASVFLDQRPVGQAPLELPVRGRWIYEGARSRHTITARSDGLQSGRYYLEPTEVFVPGAIGCIVLLGLGCPWLVQIPDEVNVRLHPTDAP